MTTEEQLQAANEALKNIHIKQSIPADFTFNPAYSPDDRDLLTKHSIEKKLAGMDAQIIIDKGEAKLVRKSDPNLEVYDATQNKISFQKVVADAIAPLGAGYAQAQASAQPYIQHISDSEYIKDGIRHFKQGNRTYTDPIDLRRKQLSQPQPRSVQEHQAYWDKVLGINP